jgi:putative tricarboxylic transport membrane protein
MITRAGRDVWIGLVTILLAAGYLEQVGGVRTGGNAAGVGPRAYPTVLGWVLLATGVALVVTALLAARHAVPAERPALVRPSGRHVQVVAMAGLTVAYLVVLGPLGFLLSTAPYLAAAIVVVDAREHYRGRRIVIPLLAGVLMSAALHLVFDAALGVSLPSGVLDPPWGM